MNAAGFIDHAAGDMARVATRLGVAEKPPEAATLERATQAMGSTADALSARLQALPDAQALEAMGDRIEVSQHHAADLAVVRSLPPTHLRRCCTERHNRVFVDYRRHD